MGLSDDDDDAPPMALPLGVSIDAVEMVRPPQP